MQPWSVEAVYMLLLRLHRKLAHPLQPHRALRDALLPSTPTSQRPQTPALKPPKLLQTHRSSNILPAPKRDLILPSLRLQRDFEASDSARQSFRIIVALKLPVALDDVVDDLADIAIKALLDFLVGFADVACRCALFLAEDVAAEDFEFGEGVAAVDAEGVHDFDHVELVAVCC
jgi:hypothetical protein